jgi:hypothetical protein
MARLHTHEQEQPIAVPFCVFTGSSTHRRRLAVAAEAAWWRSSELLGQALHGGVGDKVNHAPQTRIWDGKTREEEVAERQGKRRLLASSSVGNK